MPVQEDRTDKGDHMYGLGHRYCQNCNHAVPSGYGRNCSGCGTGFGEMIMLDEAIDGGMWSQGGPSIGFDPFDGQMVINEGGIGFEPGTGQMVINEGGIGIPI
jgi:hypothetical protein